MNKETQIKDIIIFQDDETALGYKFAESFPIDFPLENISIKSSEYDVDFFKEHNLQIIGDQPKNSQDIFLKHPYLDNTYINSDFSDLQDYFLKQKINFYKKVAKDLGATAINAKVSRIEISEDEINVKVDGKHVSGVGVEIDVKNNEKSDFQNKYSFESRFEIQKNHNLSDNIDRMKEFINSHNLNHELDLISLIDSRDSRISGNLLKYEKITSEITSEINKLKKISGRLRIPVFSLKADFERNISTYTKIELEIEYFF